MIIDAAALERWSKYDTGPIESAQVTHKAIRDTISNSNELTTSQYEDFLQGSYANYTITRGNSDVDIVLKLTKATYGDVSDCDDEDIQQWRQNQTEPDYSYNDFREEVLAALRDTYNPSAVSEGNKAVEITASGLPRDADLVIAMKLKKYYSYPNGYYEGIAFWDANQNQIYNYPKRHINNGSKKQDDTNKRFKETVRIFKRARDALDEDYSLNGDYVPSYFIENLLYNVPDGRYSYNKVDRFEKILTYLEDTDYSDWLCQNGVTPLFGSGDTKWRTRYANRFISTLRDNWDG